jgi:hypothetical protein
MDNPTTLLVAIMFVTIVVTGLVNILMFLSDLVAGKSKTGPLHVSWIALLLVAYFNFFWFRYGQYASISRSIPLAT